MIKSKDKFTNFENKVLKIVTIINVKELFSS